MDTIATERSTWYQEFTKYIAEKFEEKKRDPIIDQSINNISGKSPFESFLMSLFKIFSSPLNIFIFILFLMIFSILIDYLINTRNCTVFKNFNYLILTGIVFKVLFMLQACALICSESKYSKSFSPINLYGEYILVLEVSQIISFSNIIYKGNLLERKSFCIAKKILDSFLIVFLTFINANNRLDMVAIFLLFIYLLFFTILPFLLYKAYNLIFN